MQFCFLGSLGRIDRVESVSAQYIFFGFQFSILSCLSSSWGSIEPFLSPFTGTLVVSWWTNYIGGLVCYCWWLNSSGRLREFVSLRETLSGKRQEW